MTISVPESFAALVESLTGKGHVLEPLFDPRYSPGSRMPCIDFTPWIIQMLAQEDYGEICKLVSRFMGNADVAKALVQNTVCAPLEYLIDGEPEFFREFRAASIMLNQRSGMTESIKALLLSNFLFIHYFRIKAEYRPIICSRLNKFLGSDLPQSTLDYPPDYPDKNPVMEWLTQIPMSMRAHFLTTLDWMSTRGSAAISLRGTTDSTLREFGIDIAQSVAWLRSSGAFPIAVELNEISHCVPKEEFVGIARQAGVGFNPRSPKKKILETVQGVSDVSGALLGYAEEHELVVVAPECKEFIQHVLSFCDRAQPRCAALALNLSVTKADMETVNRHK
jgi:hypothetical protein